MIKRLNLSKLNKSLRREQKRNKRKYGMRRDGDSVKTIQRFQEKRKKKIWQQRRKEKEKFLEDE